MIVCLQQDHEFNDLPTLDEQDVLDHNGLVQKGKVVDYRRTPVFKTKYIITGIRNNYGWQSYSWEQVVFALFYPREDMMLQCGSEYIKEEPIDHSQFSIRLLLLYRPLSFHQATAK